MHTFIEGLAGCEVVDDDLLIVGHGTTMTEAEKDHNQNLLSLLERCRQKNLRLNWEKLKLCQTEVSFIGHVATSQGLKADSAKVSAVKNMSPLTDVAGMRRFLGLAQYLAKFLPNLADKTKPLRDLLLKTTEWSWDAPQQESFQAVKQAATCTPILRFYSLQEEVTLQCDASKDGLGAALLQNGQPVVYASRSMTSVEQRYTQIEKELLAIVFGCEKFHVYVFGHDKISVQSDHKPLETIFKKQLSEVPARLQRMMLHLQKYSLDVPYHRGKEMYLADALSRATVFESPTKTERELEDVVQVHSLAVSPDQLERLKEATRNDYVLQQLKTAIWEGWTGKSSVSDVVQPYCSFCCELTIEDDLIFKGNQVVVPASMHQEILACAHASHIGVESCLRRMCKTMFWPRMSSDMRWYISECQVCLRYS